MPRASWPCVSEAGQARRRSTVAGGEADAVVALGRLVGQGLPAVLVTVVAVEGNPPSHPGAKLVFSGDRVVAGTLGCSEFDTAGAALAAELASAAVGHAGSCRPGARSGSPAALRRRAVFGHGGQQVLDMFAERFEPSPGAIVAGDNPVGRSVAELAGLIGWRIRLIEGPTDPVDDLTRQPPRSEEHTSELQSRGHLVCRLLLEKK